MSSLALARGRRPTVEDLEAYDDVLARFGDATEPALREQVATALVNKSITLGALGRSDEALVVTDDVLARFGDATDPALRRLVDRLPDRRPVWRSWRRRR